MQISNGHPDTPPHVWTKYGYMKREDLVPSGRREETHNDVTIWSEYRALQTGELVRRDCHVTLKQGLVIGAHLNL